MNNGITGDNDLNLALDVTAGQMNYSSITNSSTCFVVSAPNPNPNPELQLHHQVQHMLCGEHSQRLPQRIYPLVSSLAYAWISRARPAASWMCACLVWSVRPRH